MNSVEEIKKALISNALIGKKLVLANLKLGKVKKVLISSNCPESLKKDVQYYAGLSKAEILQLDIPNDEIGVVAKKLYSISILGY